MKEKNQQCFWWEEKGLENTFKHSPGLNRCWPQSFVSFKEEWKDSFFYAIYKFGTSQLHSSSLSSPDNQRNNLGWRRIALSS